MQKLDIDELDKILVFTAKMCLDELRVDGDIDELDLLNEVTVGHETEHVSKTSMSNQGPKTPLGIDSTAVKVDRYEDVEMSRSFGRETFQTRAKKPLKWHTQAITAIR